MKWVKSMSLKICFIGCFAIYSGSQQLYIPLRGCTRELLAYLLLHPSREIRREKLASLFWPDRCEASVRNLLSTALWRIRKVVSGIDGVELQANAGTVRIIFNTGVESDAALLMSAIRRCEAANAGDKDYRFLEDSIGPEDFEFLDGVSSDWALIERERYTNLRLTALVKLMTQAADNHHFEDAIGFAGRVLMIDPFRENIQRQLMWLCVQVGRPAHAVRQFERFQKLLLAELNLKPMPETMALCALIQDDANLAPMQQTFDAASTRRQSVYEALVSLTS
jgi:DNA-binding SARP family transcriptional activator